MEKMKKEHNMNLLNVGSCGLYIGHNAFRDGCSAAFLEVDKTTSSAYWFFKDFPSQRENFASVNPEFKIPTEISQTQAGREWKCLSSTFRSYA